MCILYIPHLVVRYMELMQKQRLELEALLAQKLRQQEDALVKQANAVIQEKDNGAEAVIKSAIESQQAQLNEQLKSERERMEQEFNSHYEQEYAAAIAEKKGEFATELQEKLQAVESLSKTVEQLKSALSVSRSYESGSLKAHRVSAAALALAEKLETSSGAAPELAALEVCFNSLLVLLRLFLIDAIPRVPPMAIA